MTKLVHPCADTEGQHRGWMIMCPGCGFGHLFDARWTYNGDESKPTFSPSMLVNGSFTEEEKKKYNVLRCHSFVRDGKIEFPSDCDHALKGQTVALEEF